MPRKAIKTTLYVAGWTVIAASACACFVVLLHGGRRVSNAVAGVFVLGMASLWIESEIVIDKT